MKKANIIFVMVFYVILSIPVFGEDILFKVTEDVPVWGNTSFYWENRIDRIIPKGTIVKGIRMPFLTDVMNVSAYAQVIIFEGNEYTMQTSVLIPVETKELFDTSLITDPYNEEQTFWKLDHYLDVLRSEDRDTLLKYEKDNIDFHIKLQSQEAYKIEWWENDNFYDNSLLLFQSSLSISGMYPLPFWIHSIETIENGYKISVTKEILWLEFSSIFSGSWEDYGLYVDKPIYDLYFIYDGDYLDVYVESLDNHVVSLVKMDKTIQEELVNLFQNNRIDKSRIVFWPRRANGSMDYPPPIDMNSYKTTHHTTDNLRLRDNPNTTSLMVTTLNKGSAVQVLETGEMQTIDGISAPWVKVLSKSIK